LSSKKTKDDLASLIVSEVNSKDVGRRIARIDPIVAERLKLSSGDAIEISAGKKMTTVLNWPAYSKDIGKGFIRIDGYIRNKLDIGIGDKVEIKKTEVKDAKSITLVPMEPLRIMNPGEYLAEMLAGQIVTKGDIIPISIMGQRIDLTVVSTMPSGAVIIQKNTDYNL
jgi:transitional endoplasmic reticulum ATPase